MLFYLLSLLTGVLEIGWIAYGVVNSFPLWQVLCYPLAYHLGNMFPRPISMSDRGLRMAAFMAMITSGLSGVRSLDGNMQFLLTCISLFLLSAVIQSVRSGLKQDGNRLMKRVFRVIGFALAPLATVIPSVILVGTSIVAIYSLHGHKSQCRICAMSSQQGFSAVMVFHQLHYFLYAQITLAAVGFALTQKSSYGVFIAALLFCGTWITYMSVEPLATKLKANVRKVFYAGHILVAMILFVMSYVDKGGMFIILWLLTGFGGGAVYTISALAKRAGKYDTTPMQVSENIGHLLGLVIAVVVSVLAGDHAPVIMLRFGASSALLAVISMLIVSRKMRGE